MGIGAVGGAFIAGVLTTLSPCVLPILPIVLGAAASERKYGPAALAAGLAVSFVAVGLFVATIGYSIGLTSDLFRQIAAALMIVLGAVLLLQAGVAMVTGSMAGGPIANWTDRRFGAQHGGGYAGQFGVGLILGAVWSPCVGPTLGAASLLAAQGRQMTRHLSDWLDLRLADITADMVENRHRHIGGAIGNGTMRVLRVLWKFAAERTPGLPDSPVRLGRQWFPTPRRTRMVRFEDLPKFYRAVCDLPNPSARDYILLLLFTGLRRSEAASLTWETDIDLPGRVIRIPGIRTKTGTKLDLPMSSFVHDLLVARRGLTRSKYVFIAVHVTDPSTHTSFQISQLRLASARVGDCYRQHLQGFCQVWMARCSPICLPHRFLQEFPTHRIRPTTKCVSFRHCSSIQNDLARTDSKRHLLHELA
jgi:cytochrome c biogenesis protein CcdA